MRRRNPYEDIPSLDELREKYSLTEEQKKKARFYTSIISPFLLIATGASLAFAGIVLLAMMSVQFAVLPVIGAATMLGFGAVGAVGGYLWLTSPV